MKQDYYVYFHYTADDNRLFYIGKGRGKRSIWTFGRNTYWTRIVNKHGLRVEKVLVNMLDEEAKMWEIALISAFRTRGYRLCNATLGGEGVPEWVPRAKVSEERKEFLSKTMRGAGNPFYGKTHSPEVVSFLKERMRGENHPFFGIASEEHPMYGKVHSDETKKKMRSSAHYGSENASHRPEVRAKIIEKKTGMKYKFSERPHTRKTYHGFVSPTGEVYASVVGISNFAEKHKLDAGALIKVDRGQYPQHKGWKKYGN